MGAELQVREFDHNGETDIGLTSIDAIDKDEIILVVPKPLRLPVDEALQPRFVGGRRLKSPGPSQAGLWLAEQRAALGGDSAASSAKVKNVDKTTPKAVALWSAYLKSLPSYDDLQISGIPLLQPLSVLKPLLELPLQISVIPKYVLATRKELEGDLQIYNANRGDRPKLSWADALWGRAIADSRAYSCKGASLVPVGDMLNATAGEANVSAVCDEDITASTAMMFVAKHDIAPGEELTVNYSEGTEGLTSTGVSGTWLVKKYGNARGAPVEPWPREVCDQVDTANLGRSRNKLLQALVNLAKTNCSPQPASAKEVARVTIEQGSNGDLGEAKIAASPLAPKVPTTKMQSIGPLLNLAVLSYQRQCDLFCRTRRASDFL